MAVLLCLEDGAVTLGARFGTGVLARLRGKWMIFAKMASLLEAVTRLVDRSLGEIGRTPIVARRAADPIKIGTR